MSIRILVEGFSSPKHCEMIGALAERSFKIVYWTAKKMVKDFIRQHPRHFQETIFHDYTDALAGFGAEGVDTSTFNPIGTDILEALVHYEPQILSLMTRLDFGDITFLEKHHRYYQYVWYWHGLLSHLKPNIVIFHDIPHIVYNTVLYHVAKLLGIKTVLMRPLTSMRDRVAFFEDFYDYAEVRREYERLDASIARIEDVDASIREMYNGLKQLTANNVPHSYAAYSGYSGKEKSVEVLPKFSRIVTSVGQFRFFRTSFNYLRLLFTRRELCSITKQAPLGLTIVWRNIGYRRLRKSFKKEYESLHQAVPDLSQPYIYFPLHSQPEATTNPMGGVYDDQILAADLLAKALPPGWKLYVKEHADQWVLPRVHTGRYPGYYKTLARPKNVELISAQVSGFDLIQNAKAVATIGGSTAVEAVVKQKPAFVFGYTMYGDCDGIFRINTFQSCLAAMKKVADGYVPETLKVLRFFQALHNVSVGAFIHKRHGDGSKYSYEESVEHLTDGLYQACLR